MRRLPKSWPLPASPERGWRPCAALIQNPPVRAPIFQLDAFTTEALTTGGGSGQPVYLEDEVFAAIEFPSADNLASQGRVTLTHFPGQRLAPGAKWRSQAALVSVAPAGRANAHFLDYLEAHSRPRPPLLSVYTPFGINNQWGANPTLSDEETLDVLGHLKQLRRRGIAFDYFTLDTGWTDFSSDLTRFRPTSYPHGPAEVIAAIRAQTKSKRNESAIQAMKTRLVSSGS